MMKILKWINCLNKMKMQDKRVYTLAEIASLDHTTIKSAKTILQRLKQNKILLHIYKNIWGLPEATIYDVARLFDPDSYYSMESALSHYNIIKQSPQVFHFISKRLSKKRQTKLGIIYFHKIKGDLYFGFRQYIAEPEKALLDYLYFCLRQGRRPFLDCDLNDLSLLDMDKLGDYARRFPKSLRPCLILPMSYRR